MANSFARGNMSRVGHWSTDQPYCSSDHGSHCEIAQLFPPQERDAVYAVPNDPEFGRRLYVRGLNGAIFKATGGAILCDKSGKSYQLTAGRVFGGKEGIRPLVPKSTFLHDLEHDVETDSDMSASDQSTTAGHGNPALQPPHDFDLRPSESSVPEPEAVLDHEGKGKELELPRAAVRIGRLATAHLSHVNGSPDCALIELEGTHRDECNDVSHAHGSDIKRRVRQFSRIRDEVLVVVITPSGPVTGRLLPAESHYLPQGSNRIIRTYEVLLKDRSLGRGDAGAGVIDSQLGYLYGHVVDGIAGSRSAYMLSGEDIIEFVAKALGKDSSFASPSTVEGHGSAWFEPQAVRELGSRQYRSEVLGRDVPKRTWYQRLLPSVMVGSARETGSSTSTPAARPRGRPAICSGFEGRFFDLPGELKIHIMAFIPPRSLMHLRNTSRSWRSLIEGSGELISKLLVHRPLPRLTRNLRHLDAFGLEDVFEIWHRNNVAIKLATHISNWMVEEYWARRNERQKAKFQEEKARLRRRLVPRLFFAFFFFEALSRSLSQSHGSTDGNAPKDVRKAAVDRPFDSSARFDWRDDDIISQARRIFPIVAAFLERILRPASYHSRAERILRREWREAPPEDVPARILYAGALGAVTRFADTGNYMQRRKAVDEFLELRPLPLVTPPTLRELWHQIQTGSSHNEVVRDGWQLRYIRISPAVMNELVAEAATEEDELYEEHRLWGDEPE